MTRIYAFLCALALLGLTANGCAWFEKHPVIPAVVTCSGETIPLALVTQIYDDVIAENWIDLTLNVVPLLKDGYSDLECVFGYLKTSNPETAPHIEKLKAKHADEFKGSVSLRSPGDSTTPVGPTAMRSSFDISVSDPATMTFEHLSSCPAGSEYGLVDGRPACLSLGRSGGIHMVGYVTPRWTPSISSASLEKPTLASCDLACGGKNTSLAPPSGCLCTTGAGRSARWLAAR